MINLYELYISHRPTECKLPDFYLARINNPTSSVWYKAQPLGIHQIEGVTKRFMSSIGKTGYYTNTSLRRSAKTRLVKAGIPKEVVKKRMGHISDADEVYIHEQLMEREMGSILSGSNPQPVSSVVPSTSFLSESEQEANKPNKTIIFNNCSFNNCTF